jgi:hypothetical protein
MSSIPEAPEDELAVAVVGAHLEATLAAARVARWVGAALLVIGFVYDVKLLLSALFVLVGAVRTSTPYTDAVTTTRRCTRPP